MPKFKNIARMEVRKTAAHEGYVSKPTREERRLKRDTHKAMLEHLAKLKRDAKRQQREALAILNNISRSVTNRVAEEIGTGRKVYYGYEIGGDVLEFAKVKGLEHALSPKDWEDEHAYLITSTYPGQDELTSPFDKAWLDAGWILHPRGTFEAADPSVSWGTHPPIPGALDPLRFA